MKPKLQKSPNGGHAVCVPREDGTLVEIGSVERTHAAGRWRFRARSDLRAVLGVFGTRREAAETVVLHAISCRAPVTIPGTGVTELGTPA